MARKEFSKATKAKAFKRCGGPDNPRCERCGRSLLTHPYQFDHDVPDGLGGDNSLDNCKVLCSGSRISCHGIKSEEEDKPRMQKADNVRNKHQGITAAKRRIPQSPRAPKRPSKPALPPRPIYKTAS